MDPRYQMLLVKSTQIRMMRERGYNIPDDEQGVFDLLLQYKNLFATGDTEGTEEVLKDFTDIYEQGSRFNRSYLSRIYRNESTYKSIYIEYYNEMDKQVSKNDVTIFTTNATGLNGVKEREEKEGYVLEKAILISALQMDSTSKDIFEKPIEVLFQHFLDQELFCVIIDNFLVPKHELLELAETKDWLRDNMVVDLKGMPDGKKLPWIRSSDAVCKFYGWVGSEYVNRIVRIYRQEYFINNFRTVTIGYRVIIP